MKSTLLLFLFVLLCSVCNGRPNIIIVLADDQGYGDMACYGNEYLRTPNMDRLYSESTRLIRFYVSPVCSPSRASLLTGRYNQRTGVWDTYRGRCSLHPDEYTLAEALSDSGYSTALFGKWHLGRHSPSLPSEQGFSTVVRDVYKPNRGRLNPIIETNGDEEHRVGFLTDIIFDEAIEWINRQSNLDKPFFAYICPRLVHASAQPQVPERYARRFHQMDDLESHTAEVYGMTELLDECLGRLLDHVDKLGIGQETIIIYTSDNGPQMHGGNWSNSRQQRFNKSLRGAKGSVYEGGILVPFFIKWEDKLPENKDIESIASHIDLMPTILDLCEINPQLPNSLDGISLAMALRGESLLPERSLFFQFQRAEVPELWNNTALISRKYKLVNGNQLFNLESDPTESKNLSKTSSKLVDEMRFDTEEIFDDIEQTRQFFPTPISLDTIPPKGIALSPISDMGSKGFYIQLSEPGEYLLQITGLQNKLQQAETELVISIDGQTLKQPTTNSASTLIFDNVKLQPGTYYLKVDFDKEIAEKKWLYGLNDPGYRGLVISRNHLPK